MGFYYIRLLDVFSSELSHFRMPFLNFEIRTHNPRPKDSLIAKNYLFKFLNNHMRMILFCEPQCLMESLD